MATKKSYFHSLAKNCLFYLYSMTCNAMGWQGILQFNQNFILAFTKKTGWVIFSLSMWHKQKFRIKNIPVNDLREMWPHRESIMTPKFQCGTTCTKGPDREMLACESTTPRCNPLRRQADCRKAGVCGVSSKQSFFFFFWHFSQRLLLPFHILCLVSFISERQMFNFWTLVNILQIKFIISDKDTFSFKSNNPYL